MRTLIAAGIWLAYSLPALGQGVCTGNCTTLYKRPLSARELCFAQTSALRQVVEVQSMEIVRLRAELEKASAPVYQIVEPNKVMKRLPCKRGRTRNSAGICGRWK